MLFSINACNYGDVQSAFFSLNNTLGLTDVIEEGIPLSSVCQKSPVENLDVLPRGQLLINPSAVIESPNMQKLLNEASSLYDWIIVDAVPITESSELISLSQYAEGLAMIVRPNFQSKYKIREVVNEFQRENTHLPEERARAAVALCVGGLLVGAACGKDPMGDEIAGAARQYITELLST